jgi:hypothetical protein
MVDGKWVRQQIDQSNSAARHWFASRARSARASSALRQWGRFEALFEVDFGDFQFCAYFSRMHIGLRLSESLRALFMACRFLAVFGRFWGCFGRKRRVPFLESERGISFRTQFGWDRVYATRTLSSPKFPIMRARRCDWPGGYERMDRTFLTPLIPGF